MIKCVLFDLDMTLLDTSHLQSLRDLCSWTQIKDELDKVKDFGNKSDGFAHNLPKLIRDRKLLVGIVTSSPKKYATDILSKFDIPYDALIAYEDSSSQKPSPEPLNKALRWLDVNSSETVYLGDSISDFQACSLAGVKSLGAGWGSDEFQSISRCAPDIQLTKPSDLIKFLDGNKLGYICEEFAAENYSEIHNGSILHVDKNIIALGRYYKTSDERHSISILSQNLLDLKENDGHAMMFTSALESLLSPYQGPFYVVPVPPRPTEERNKFEKCLLELKKRIPDKVEVILDGLRCTKNDPEYKSKNIEERVLSRRGMFKSKFNWSRKKVLLIDDVLTTGVTLKACSDLIRRDIPRKVVSIAFAKTQDVLKYHLCPKCAGKLIIRENHSTKEMFWGCSGYRQDGGGCKHTESI